MTKEKIPKAIPTPPKKNKSVWKPKEEAPKSTITPPRTNKMVWRPKKEQPSASTSLGLGAPSSKNQTGKGPTHWTLKGESLPKVNW